MHDGIPFIEFGGADNKWYINPSYIIRIADADESTLKARKLKKPSALLYLVNGVSDGYGIEGVTAAQLMEKINKTMISYKDKLADKAILE